MTQKVIDLFEEKKKMLIPLLIVVLVIVVFYLIYKRIQWNKENPIFLKKPYILKKHNYKKKIIRSNKLPHICNMKFTLCFWMKVYGYNYLYDNYKSVLYIGNNNAEKTDLDHGGPAPRWPNGYGRWSCGRDWPLSRGDG